ANLVGLGHDVVAGDAGVPSCWFEQRRQHADDGALAGAVGTEESEDRAVVDLEVDAIDRLHVAEVAYQTLGDDRRSPILFVVLHGLPSARPRSPSTRAPPCTACRRVAPRGD